jgi:hypothetical protein
MVFSILVVIMQVVVVLVTIRKTLLVGELLVLAAADTRLETEQKILEAAEVEQVLARQVLAVQALLSFGTQFNRRYICQS